MTAHSHDRPLLALFIRVLGVAGFATMAALIKLASERGMHIAELIFWRQLVSVPIILVWVLFSGGIMQLATKRPKAHAMRGIYGMVGMALNFGAVMLLPLAEATTINLSVPIWAVILSVVILKEPVGIWRISAVLTGFLGIILIAQPGSGSIPLVGAAVAMGGAFMIGLISIQIRELSSTEEPRVIVFWFSVMTVICAAPVLPFVYQAHTAEEWLLLIGIGVSGTWGQLLVTMALRYGKVSSVIVMDYSSIIWATILGWLIFAVLPSPMTWVGAPLVIGAGLIITWRERVLSKRKFVDLRQV